MISPIRPIAALSSCPTPGTAKVRVLPKLSTLATGGLGYAGGQGLEHGHRPGVDVYVVNIDLVVQVQF